MPMESAGAIYRRARAVPRIGAGRAAYRCRKRFIKEENLEGRLAGVADAEMYVEGSGAPGSR
jgi:hypothetical protein